jgi:hypothetical protein
MNVDSELFLVVCSEAVLIEGIAVSLGWCAVAHVNRELRAQK